MLLALLIFFGVQQLSVAGARLPGDGRGDELNCECVPFYNCGADGYIRTDGTLDGLAPLFETKSDLRVYNVLKCPSYEGRATDRVCCNLPPGFTVPPAGVPDTASVTPDTCTSSETSPGVDRPLVAQPHTAAISFPRGCGRASFDVRITDGDDAKYGEHPWMVMLVTTSADDPWHVVHCGGSLIHPRVVLTAAHCVPTDPATLLARVGEHVTDSDEEASPHQERRVREARVPAGHDRMTMRDDVALLVLVEPFHAGVAVGVVCLPRRDETFEDAGHCVATGWGTRGHVIDADHEHPTTLQAVTLKVIPSTKCEDQLRATRLGTYFTLDRSFLCAKGDGKKDTCQGDGGGPLVCPAADGSFVQTGITAWGIGCGGEVPGVYADVAYARHWIDEQMVELGLEVNGGADPK